SDLCRLIWCALIGLFRPRAALEAEILTRASLFGGSLYASPMSAPQSNLRSWTIGQQHHPIRTRELGQYSTHKVEQSLPPTLSFRTPCCSAHFPPISVARSCRMAV